MNQLYNYLQNIIKVQHYLNVDNKIKTLIEDRKKLDELFNRIS